MARLRARPPGPARVCEALAIASAAGLWLALALRAFARLDGAAFLWLDVPCAVVAGVLFADLLSGLVHFTCDRFFSERTPLLGATFIAPFREHHRDPQGIARHGFCERNGNNCIALLPLLALAHATMPATRASTVHLWLLALCAALAATNEAHAWAHREHVPRLVRRLQRAGLLLAPAAHRVHHELGHTRAYCITTGWLNPILDRHGVWRALESAVRAVARAARG